MNWLLIQIRRIKMVKNKTSLTGEKVTESFQEATKVLRNKAYEKKIR